MLLDQSALSIYLRRSNLFISKIPKIGFQDQLSLNEGQKYNFDLHKATSRHEDLCFVYFLSGSLRQVLLCYILCCCVLRSFILKAIKTQLIQILFFPMHSNVISFSCVFTIFPYVQERFNKTWA